MINVQICNTWARQAISSMFGYHGPSDDNDPFYSVQAAISGLNTETYGTLVGPCYSACYAPLLIFMGYLTERCNRKYIIGVACTLCAAICYANSIATNIN